MSSTPRNQIRLHAITGSMADISTVANQRVAAPAASVSADNLHDILDTPPSRLHVSTVLRLSQKPRPVSLHTPKQYSQVASK